MSLQAINDQGLLFNTNFLTRTSEDSMMGFRGELILIEGETGDNKGHSKPPAEVMRGAVILDKNEELVLVVGSLDEVASITTFFEKYKSHFASDIKVLLYIVNIAAPMQVEIDGINLVLIPLVQGVPWNEVIEELGLLKSDFKGQSAADKIVTLYNEFQSYSPKYKAVTLDEALAAKTDAKREAWGAV